MAGLPSAAPYTLWILFFSYTTNKVITAGHIQEFACFTDYDKELVCHWKVPAQTNCSKEFLLCYSKEISSVSNVCVPENEKDSLQCTCTIYPDYFAYGLTYILALQFNGTDTWNYSVTPALVVKPRAPKNLAIEKAENGNFNLSWEESYSPPSMLSGQPVIYEVKYWRKQHPAKVSVKAINYQTKSFEITASSLRRGYDYVASLRCNYMDYPAYWSEWSEEVEFHYDYQVTAEDILQMAVPISCILIMAGSIICYFCFTKVKKEWWDQIPNPAKSHLVVKNVKFSVLCYFDEIKFPFHDLKQSHVEKQISCKNCLAQSLSSQNVKGKDNIRNVEKSCSCHMKSGEWLPKGSSSRAVLTPDTIPVEESIEICECLTDSETESQEETGNQITTFEPCESIISAFIEHPEHNELLANMFDALLADENNMQDSKGPDILTGERKTFEKLGSENPSQRNPKESAAQSQQPCDISHTSSLFTKASQDDYNCSTGSKESELSEESFESGYRSSSINSASLDSRDLQQMVHQSLFLCSSENELDSCVLIQESTNKSFGTKTDRMNNPADKTCDTLLSPSLEPCGSAYKSCDTLLSPSLEPCDSAYRSFDMLESACKESSSSAYKSFNALVSQSMANTGLTPCVESVCSSLPLTQLSETPERRCRDQIAQRASNQTCSINYRSPCTKLDFSNTCSEHTDFPSFSTGANEGTSAFLSEEEIHKQVIYQNVQRKTNIISCPVAPQPSGYQPFDSAGKRNTPYCDSDNEVISRSLYESFISLCNNLSEVPPDTAICEPDLRIKDCVCLSVRGSDCIVLGLARSEDDTQTSDGSPWINSSNELRGDSNDENTGRDEQLLHLLEMKCQDLNSRERATKETKQKIFNPTGKVMQECSDNRLNTDFHCHPHSHLRELGNAGGSEEVLKHAEGRGCGSATSLPASLDSIRLNLHKKTAEPRELHISPKVSPCHLVNNCCPSDSHAIHSEDSRLALAVKKRSVELLRENSRKNEKKMKLVQDLAQEDNCYMEVA